MHDVSRAVLITGCSTGIGAATARHLVTRGWKVYATARRLEKLEDLAAAGCDTMTLDVTSEESMRAAVRAVEEREGAVGVLINNAGYSQSGAVEEVSPERLRQQFETNVFGTVRLTQLVLPAMRRQRWGRIVNVGSIAGRLTFPGGGIYHATKHALEAVSDALRFEVRAFGIDVVHIQPGLIRTHFSATAVGSMTANAPSSPYAALNESVARLTHEAYTRGLLGKLAGDPEHAARVIARAVAARHPRPRYKVLLMSHLLLALRAATTDRLWDTFLRAFYSEPRPR
ncbi:MAG TPA: SDR family NAD(P)-dependent oxidoreductase [Candidatus Krumholzibacteria bacterium]|nr:SDR family NAD(P)-dependent oxidoreductase [Candidatus Krumholzibacteria bacterium]